MATFCFLFGEDTLGGNFACGENVEQVWGALGENVDMWRDSLGCTWGRRWEHLGGWVGGGMHPRECVGVGVGATGRHLGDI